MGRHETYNQPNINLAVLYHSIPTARITGTSYFVNVDLFGFSV